MDSLLSFFLPKVSQYSPQYCLSTCWLTLSLRQLEDLVSTHPRGDGELGVQNSNLGLNLIYHWKNHKLLLAICALKVSLVCSYPQTNRVLQPRANPTN